MFVSSDTFADKQHVRPCLSLTSAANPTRVLRSEVFVSEDLQVRADHLILGYDPLSENFQDIGNAIIVGDQRRRRIDISKLDFLAPHDLPETLLSSYVRVHQKQSLPRHNLNQQPFEKTTHPLAYPSRKK